MGIKSEDAIVVGVDCLAGYFLKLLQRDGAIGNKTFLAAMEMLKEEEQNVNSSKIHKSRAQADI